MPGARKALLLNLFHRLHKAFGPRHWWPADSPFEVVVGAILTQNTAWRNVKKAISNLKAEGLLSAHCLNNLPMEQLAALIRPAGYYNMKTKRLKHFLDFLYEETGGDLERLMTRDFGTLRDQLLSVNGIGPETADSILLYAGNKPSFVVDAYTKRILFRHRLVPEDVSYDETRDFFMDCLEPHVPTFNEFHALLVHLGHSYCLKSNPKCTACPAEGWNEQ
jgi:endonuclease-3 related protein